MTCCGKKLNSGFTPNYRFRALTEKFYARHESLNMDPVVNKCPLLAYYKREISKRLKDDPREHRLAPITENQMYGWIEYWATRCVDKYDTDILFYPMKKDETMEILKQIVFETKRTGHR